MPALQQSNSSKFSPFSENRTKTPQLLFRMATTIHALPFSLSPNQTPRRHYPLSCSLSTTQADQQSSPPLRFVFTGGGSGGHIYPAIAIADELRNLRPNSNFLFLGTSSGLESTIVPSVGYDFTSIPSSRLSRPFLSVRNLLFPFRLLHAIASAWRILRRFRPHVVIGTGGYVAAPVCLAAALSGTRIAIQEQNAFPGIANRIASPFASKVFVAFGECLKHFPDEKCSVFGNPVRVSLRGCVPKAVARKRFFPDEAEKVGEGKARVVLVLGGSQGANPINVAVLNMYCDMLLRHGNRYIIWQTGKDGFREMKSLVKNHRRLLLTP